MIFGYLAVRRARRAYEIERLRTLMADNDRRLAELRGREECSACVQIYGSPVLSRGPA